MKDNLDWNFVLNSSADEMVEKLLDIMEEEGGCWEMPLGHYECTGNLEQAIKMLYDQDRIYSVRLHGKYETRTIWCLQRYHED